MPQKSGGRRTARIVLNIQEGTEQLGMRQTTVSEMAPRERTTSRYAEWTQSPEDYRVVKTEPDSQEGTKGRRGRRSGGRVLNGEKGVGWSRRRLATSRGHQGDSVSRFGSTQEISLFPGRVRYYAQILSDTRSDFRVVFVFRASLRSAAHECISPALRCVLRQCTRHILNFASLLFKRACLLPDIVLA